MYDTTGEIRLFAANFAPRNWAFCQGQLLPLQRYTALYALLGSIYGGNGTSTFALPNLCGRTAVGAGQSPGTSLYDPGQQSGSSSVTLSSGNMPAHTHISVPGTSTPGSGTATLNAVNSADSTTPAGHYLGTDTVANFYAPASSATVPMATGSLSIATATGPQVTSVVLANNGGSVPHNNMQPYLVLNYIICMQGDFPARN